VPTATGNQADICIARQRRLRCHYDETAAADLCAELPERLLACSLRITTRQAVELSSARNYTRQIPARSRRGGAYPAMAVMTDRMTIVIKHEAVKDTGSVSAV
jgi:hypothetical protein